MRVRVAWRRLWRAFFWAHLRAHLDGVRLPQLIPESGVGNFDFERFVLKIMSVDHQAKSGDSGVFGEDTQVFFREHSENVWCYVHHLTLLDINARGTLVGVGAELSC